MKKKYFVDPKTGTYSNLMNEIGRPDVANALDEKKKEDRLLNYIDNVKFKYSKQPIVEEPVKQFRNDDPSTYLSNDRQAKAMKETTLFTDILTNLNKKPKFKSKVINNKFETDFKRGKQKALREFYPKKKAQGVSATAQVLPKPTAPEPIRVVEPQRDLSEIIAEAAEGTKRRELIQETQRYGNKGLGFLNLRNRGLDD